MKIYQLIARQYLMQFYPAATYAEAKLVFEIAGGVFIAKGRQLTFAGWKSRQSTLPKRPYCRR